MIERDFEKHLEYNIEEAHKKDCRLFIFNSSFYLIVNSFFIFHCISKNKISKNVKLLLFFIFIGFICASCSSTDDYKKPENPEERLEQADILFDFNDGWQGWSVGFADYTVGNEDIYELNYTLTNLPAEIDNNQEAIMISGHNRSDDLFMFLKHKIDNLLPVTTYDLKFFVEIASKYPKDSYGAGGSPGSAVFLRAGGNSIEPEVIVEERPVLDYYIMNIDKGNQNADGNDMITLGDIGLENGDGDNYQKIIRHNLNTEFRATTDSNGALWVIIGTDSGFEGLTEIFYKRIGIELSPLE